MKTLCPLLIAVSITTLNLPVFAQSTVLPVINIYPLDTEGAEAPAGLPDWASFRVTHDFPPTDTVSFLIALGGTAREDADYVIGPASNMTSSFLGRWFTFPAGRNEAEIVITPADDLLIESAETVTLSLYTPPFIGFNEGAGTGGGSAEDWRNSFGFAYGSSSTATVTVLSDDIAPPPFALVTLAATDAIGSETPPGSGGNDPAVFTLARTGANLEAITVNYSLIKLTRAIPLTSPVPVMAQNGIDFDTLSGSATFATGATTAEILVSPIFDLLAEGSEYVQLALAPSFLPGSDPGGYVIDENSTAVAHILDFAPAHIPIVTLAARDPQAVEDEVLRRTGSIIVTRHGNTDDTITVSYHLSGTASSGVDYVPLPGFVTFPAGSSGVFIAIDAINDNLPEGAEGVGLTLLAPPLDVYPPPYLIGNPHTAGVAIRDHLRGSANFPDPVTPWLERLPGGMFVLGASVPNAPTSDFIIEATSDLVDWEEIGTCMSIEGFAEFVDVNAANLPARFYRMRSGAPPDP